MLKAAGRYDDAEQPARKYLELSKNVYGEVHLEVGVALANLASILTEMHQDEDAVGYYKQSLAVREKLYEGLDHAETAESLQKVALTLHTLGRCQEMLMYFERSIEMNKRLHGEEHPAVSTDLNVLGVILMKQEQYEQALPVLELSLSIREKVFGDTHPFVATALNNLAALLEKVHNYDKAQAMYSRALDIREKNLGAGHKHTIHSQNNFSDLVENKELEDYQQTRRSMDLKPIKSKIVPKKEEGNDIRAAIVTQMRVERSCRSSPR